MRLRVAVEGANDGVGMPLLPWPLRGHPFSILGHVCPVGEELSGLLPLSSDAWHRLQLSVDSR